MSIGSRTPMASIVGNESSRDADMPHSPQHSALLYLFQEVSKLASPINDTHTGTNSWVSEATQGAATPRAHEEETHSQKIPVKTCQHGHNGHTCQENKAKDRSSKAATAVQSHVEGHSPWRVLSLINLQCERLLHHTDGGEPDLSFDSSCAKLSHSVNRVPNAITSASDPDGAGVCISVECTLRPSLVGRGEEHNPSRFSSAEGACSTGVECLNISQTAAQLDVCRPVPAIPAASSTFCRDQKIAKVPFSKNCVSQTACLPHVSPRAWIFNSNADASIVEPVGTLASDQNANLVLIAAPTWDAQSPLVINSTDVCQLPPGQSGKVAPSSLVEEETKDAGIYLTTPGHSGEDNSSLAAESEPSAVQLEGEADPAAKPHRTKTPRKQAHPSRSADIQDPGFQGVTFRMDAKLDDSMEQCRLLITSKYT